MMDSIISILYYLLACFFTIKLAVNQYKQVNTTEELSVNNESNKDKKIKLASIIIIALLFTFYNVLVTHMNPSTSDDRKNYIYDFYYNYPTTPGLDFVIRIVKIFSNDIRVLYYLTTFLTMIALCFAYNVSEESNPNALLFLFCTQYIFLSFTGLKQIYAILFIVLGTSFAIRNHKHDNLYSLLCFICSFFFHQTSLIFLIIFVLIKIKKDKSIVSSIFLLMGISLIGFVPIMRLGSQILMPIVPSVAIKINEYFTQNIHISFDASTLGIVIKGLPFYLITLIGYLNRDYFIDKIKHFDSYLLLSGLLSFIYLISIYNGWLYRLAYYLYFVVGIFFVQMMNTEKFKTNYPLLNQVIYGSNLLITLRFLVLVHTRMGGF